MAGVAREVFSPGAMAVSAHTRCPTSKPSTPSQGIHVADDFIAIDKRERRRKHVAAGPFVKSIRRRWRGHEISRPPGALQWEFHFLKLIESTFAFS
jgi:hypothetical protein